MEPPEIRAFWDGVIVGVGCMSVVFIVGSVIAALMGWV